MAIPDAVKKQIDLADDILAQLKKEAGEEEEEKNIPLPLEEKVEKPVEHEVEKDYKKEYEKVLGDYNHLKSQYDTLKGKYDAEVPRLMSELTNLSSELANAKLELSDIRKKIQETPNPKEAEEEKEFRENYPDIYQFLNRSLRREIQNAIESIKSEIFNKFVETEKKVERSDAEAKWMIFKRELTDLVPDWEKINVEPGFVEYLQGIDKYSGLRKYDLLKAANARYDAKTVAVFFQEYMDSKQAKSNSKPSEIENIAPPSPSITETKQEASPRRGGAKTITRAFIKQFYRDAAIGKYTKEEAERIKKEIDKALVAGTITD